MEQLYLRRIPKRTQHPRVVMVPPPKQQDPRIILFPVMIVIFFLVALAVKYTNVRAEDAAQPITTTVPTVVPTIVPTIVPTAMPVSVLNTTFMPTVLRWETQIVEAAWRYGFDPNLLAIVIQIESCGDPTAVSRAGAMGLGQVMPYHFEPGENPYDPETNLNRAAAYFAAGLKSSGSDIGLTFAGYNGGHGTVQKGRGYWKAETVRYYDWATGIFWDIKNGTSPSPTLQRWLQAGGQSLCTQAATRTG